MQDSIQSAELLRFNWHPLSLGYLVAGNTAHNSVSTVNKTTIFGTAAQRHFDVLIPFILYASTFLVPSIAGRGNFRGPRLKCQAISPACSLALRVPATTISIRVAWQV